jgi:serine protease AprX
MAMIRKCLAGALTAQICLFGLTATAAAAGANGHGRVDPGSVVTGLDGPRYPGRRLGDHPKLDRTLNDRSNAGGLSTSRVIIVLNPGCNVDVDLAKLGGRKGRSFNIVSGAEAEVPNFVLRRLANNPCVASIHYDRPTGGEMNYAAVVEGARAVQAFYGFDGAGIGVAIIDSGITKWHDDLTYRGNNPNVKVVNSQRVVQFVDFVNGLTAPYDDNGHGSHVAGIIAGNGYDSSGARAGIAPGADIVSLKVLDQNGNGHISDVIAALNWVVANHTQYNIRVVNLSIGAPVTESYYTDPLTLAAKQVVDAGIVVVTAAGNFGKNATGQVQYGAITAPGNAPWVLTVGAYNHEGTITRADDQIASFSSRGPTAVDYKAKPDVVATGVGIASLSVPGSTLFNLYPQFLLGGVANTVSNLLGGSASTKPYLSLSGTSMASPIVAGTVALMLQANPKLTPNLAKAIIEYTSQNYGYDPLTQGAGFLNTKGAVDLALFLAHPGFGQRYPANSAWGKTILWGNRRVFGGVIKPAGTAWAVTTMWGATSDVSGNNIVWGTMCGNASCDSIVWGTYSDLDSDNIVWGSSTGAAEGTNIVWGTDADGDADNIVWGSATPDGDADNIVWGSDCGDADCDNIVWGSDVASGGLDNIVWGSATMQASNIVWGSSDGDTDNIVWGSSTDGDGDNIVWGSSSSSDDTVFADPLTTDPNASFELDSDYVVPPTGGSSDPIPGPSPVAMNMAAPPAIDPTSSPSGGDTAHVSANLAITVGATVTSVGGIC